MHLKQDTVFGKMKSEETSDKDSGSPFGRTIIPTIKPAVCYDFNSREQHVSSTYYVWSRKFSQVFPSYKKA